VTSFAQVYVTFDVQPAITGTSCSPVRLGRIVRDTARGAGAGSPALLPQYCLSVGATDPGFQVETLFGALAWELLEDRLDLTDLGRASAVACFEAAQETYAEIGAENETFKGTSASVLVDPSDRWFAPPCQLSEPTRKA